MADKNKLDKAAGTSVKDFFTDQDTKLDDERLDEAIIIVLRSGRQQDGADFLNMNKGTFSKKLKKIREEQPERYAKLQAEAEKQKETDEKPQEKQTTTVPPQSENEADTDDTKETPKEETVADEKPPEKPKTGKKQVFSFRASVDDIAIWKAYAKATDQTMEVIGTAAMNEYIKRHELTGDEKTLFELMKSRSVGK